MPRRSTQEEEEAGCAACKEASANGLHPRREWKVFVPELDALFKRKHSGDREARRWWAAIDCDRPEETCTPLLSVWGFSLCPRKSAFIAPALESPQSAADQAKQLSRDGPRRSHCGLTAINRSFITRPKETTTRRRRRKAAKGGEGAPSWKNPVKFDLGTVHVLFSAAQIETFEEEREKKSNEKNFLKEVE